MSATDDRDEGPEGPDREGVAAEYALGTLSAVERAQVASRLDLDPELAEAVARWEATLAPLSFVVPEVEPPAGLWPAIERRVAAIAGGGRPALHVVKESVATPEEEPSGAWRIWAIAATIAAVALGGLFVRERMVDRLVPGGPLVAALSADGKGPAFLISVDVARRELTIRRIGAETPSDRSHELWLVSDKVGKPVSLGLVGGQSSTAALAQYDPATFEGATYAITLEPRGGSKTGQPTGPVMWSGKLEALPKAAPAR
jgi:anti-sigma-K factor RskA